MRFRNNVLAFGISLTTAAGGGVGLAEALHYKSEHGKELACLSAKYAGSSACQNMLITPEIASATHGTQKLYSWIAGIGLVGGALGLIGTFSALEEEPKSRPEAVDHKA